MKPEGLDPVHPPEDAPPRLSLTRRAWARVRPVWRGALAMYGLAILVGFVAGVGALAFEAMLQFVSRFALDGAVGYHQPAPKGEVRLFEMGEGLALEGPLVLWALLLVPALGGFLSNLLTSAFAPEAAGHGTDAGIEAYHEKNGLIRGRVPFLKALATALSMGTGGSGGREGPIAQIGAGFGSFLGKMLQLTSRQRRILLAAGMGAGVGSIFRAPLAGALFSAEILYREAEFESDVIMPSFLACSVAYCTFCGWAGDFGTLFRMQESFHFRDLGELLPYSLLVLALVPAVWFFVRFFYGIETLVRRLPGPRPLWAAAGGLLTGAVAVLLWKGLGDERALGVLSHGYGILQESLDGRILGYEGALLLLLVAAGKAVTTSLTISSGGSGGVFGPSMVIGGGIGGALGLLFHQWGWIARPEPFVLVGMSGFFAGAASTPISTIIMVSEMTGSYELLLPAMWVCALTFLLCPRWTLYVKQVANRAKSLAHRGEYMVPLLEKMTVAEIFEPNPGLITVRQTTPLSEIIDLIATTTQDYFPVLDEEERFIGIFSSHDVRALTFEQSLYSFMLADDLMVTDPIVLSLDDDLHTAMVRFDQKKLDSLPVVMPDDKQTLLGLLPRRAITRAYQRKLDELDAMREN